MTSATSRVVVLGATARRGGQVVARLRYAGKVITVAGADGRILGRLIPGGYIKGSPDSENFDVWMAKHPMVPTPSDTLLAEDLTMADAVAFLLDN